MLKVLENDVVYGEDIVIFSKTINERVSRLTVVLERIKKYQVARDKLTRLEHVGGGVGEGDKITPLLEKRVIIRNFPPPKSKCQLRSFLSLVGYEAKFVPNFSGKAHGLFQLSRKD